MRGRRRPGTTDSDHEQPIAPNWIEAYKKYVDPGKALASESSTLPTPAPIPDEAKAKQGFDDADMLKDEAADTETTSPSISGTRLAFIPLGLAPFKRTINAFGRWRRS